MTHAEQGITQILHGARVIPGDGSQPIDDSAVVIRDGVIQSITTFPERDPDARYIDLTGKTIMPTIISVHGHIGYMKGSETARENFSYDNVIRHLRQLAYYGVSVFQSLGTDRNRTELSIRNQQRSGALDDPDLAILFSAGAGITAPTPGSENGGAFFATDVLREASSPAMAREIVKELASESPDILKFWIDDRGGTKTKLNHDVYEAIVDEGRNHNLRSVAHIFDLDDAKGAVRAGADAIAHLVRSPGSDQELMDLMRTNSVAGFSSMSIQRGTLKGLDWLDEPALAETVSKAARDSTRQEIDAMAARYPGLYDPDAYAILERGMKMYEENGITFLLSADTGVAGGYMGFAEHRELEAIVDAGIPSLKAIRSATFDAAKFLGLEDRGCISEGMRADLLVLDEDPTVDIRNSRKIADVYLSGNQLNRSVMRERLLSS